MADLFHPGYNDILGHLIAWGKSGLIPNTKLIKSFHPPIKDPVTGINTLVPATTFSTNVVSQSQGDFPLYDTIASAVTGNLTPATYKGKPITKTQLLNAGKDVVIDGTNVTGEVTAPTGTLSPAGRLNIDDYPHAPHTTDKYVVQDFNINTEPGGPDTKTATYMSNSNHIFSGAAATAKTQAEYITKVVANTAALAEPTATGTVIDPKQAQQVIFGSDGFFSSVTPALAGALGGSSGSLNPAELSGSISGRQIPALPKQDHTHADRLTFSAGLGYQLPRYTDNLADAQNFYNKNFLGLDTADTQQSSGNTINPSATGAAVKGSIPKRYELVATRVPCAVPGVLNCTLAAYDQVNVDQPQYDYRPPNIIGFHQPNNLAAAEGWRETFTGDGLTTQFLLDHELAGYKNAIFVYEGTTKMTLEYDYTLSVTATKTIATVTVYDPATVNTSYATLALVTAQIANFPVGTTFYASTDNAYYQIQWQRGAWALNFLVAPVDKAIISVFYDPSRTLKLYNNFDYYDRNGLQTATVPDSSGHYTIIGVDKS